jgi:hypothetical protein
MLSNLGEINSVEKLQPTFKVPKFVSSEQSCYVQADEQAKDTRPFTLLWNIHIYFC